MNNILKIALTLAVGIVLAGCYNDFDNPAPAKVYTDKDFTETGAEIISIKDLKAKFYEKWGHDANGLGRRVVIEDDVVIKGKVISSDAEGNVYKSLYIYDGEQAIELRLMNDNYVNYPLGQIVYVKAQGLSLASYRYMLSLGAAPALEPDGTFPNDTPSEHDFSASGNSNIPTTEMVQQYVYRGELDTITEADVTVVNKENYKTVLGTAEQREALPRLSDPFRGASQQLYDRRQQHLPQLSGKRQRRLHQQVLPGRGAADHVGLQLRQHQVLRLVALHLRDDAHVARIGQLRRPASAAMHGSPIKELPPTTPW